MRIESPFILSSIIGFIFRWPSYLFCPPVAPLTMHLSHLYRKLLGQRMIILSFLYLNIATGVHYKEMFEFTPFDLISDWARHVPVVLSGLCRLRTSQALQQGYGDLESGGVVRVGLSPMTRGSRMRAQPPGGTLALQVAARPPGLRSLRLKGSSAVSWRRLSMPFTKRRKQKQ